MSISLRSRIRRGFLLGCVSGAALLAIAVGQASAATVSSVAVESKFDGGSEGWKAAPNEGSGLLGLCIEGVTCPAVSNGYQATGGLGSSGYIETKEGGVAALGLVAENTGVWESPEFTYLGVAGQRPTRVEFSLARRAQLANLLALSGAQASYTVELVDKAAPSGTVVVVNHAPLSGAEEWKSASTEISPDLLTKGDAYKVRIRTTFITPAAVVPGGGVGYDDIDLTASRDETDEVPRGPSGPQGPGGGDGSSGSNGAPGGNGAPGKDGTGPRNNGGTKGADGGGGPSVAELREAISARGLSPTAALRHGKLTITGACPRSVEGACTVRVKGMLTRKKVATSSGRAKIAQGGKHRFVVAVNRKARRVLERQGKLLVKEWVRVGPTRVVLYKRLAVVAK